MPETVIVPTGNCTGSARPPHPDNKDRARKRGTEKIQKTLLLLCSIKGIHSSTNTDKIGHFLEIKRYSPHLNGTLLTNLSNNFLFAQWPLFVENALDNTSNCSFFVSPLFESVESTTNKNKLRIANEFIMDRLNSDIFMIELRITNTICNLHKMQWLPRLTKNN